MMYWFATILGALALGGCAPLGCTLAGCEDVVSIRFSSPDPLLPGRYDLTLQGANGTEWSCSILVGDEDGTLVLDSQGCDTDEARWVIDGNDLAVDGVRALTVATPPLGDEVTVLMMLDGRLNLASDVIALDYDVFQPNGPNCEPTCRQATVTVALP